MINIKGIIEGIVNTVQAKEEVEKVATKRRSICNKCVHNSENAKNYNSILPYIHCTICKCNLTWKTHALSESCPINKWKAVASEEEDEQIQGKIESDEQQGL